jgi:protection-of-telomeres protein 1
MWNKAISLLSNHSSEFHVLPALKIPRGPNEVPRAEWQLTPSKSSAPRTEETTYVALASLNIGGMSLPSSQEFEARVAQSMNVKDKFSLLKDVESNNFYNLLGQVIKIFDGSSSRMTVYLSDYTANSSFYEYVWNENSHTSDDRDRDEYGNKASKPRAGKDWPGPFGRLAIQLTLYDAHADFVRDNVEVDEWIFLRNVQIKFGNMGGCLEGFLRGNQNQYESAVRVEVMKQREERGGNEVRLKDATRRKYLWWKKFNQQKQAFLDDAACLGDKRKRDKEPVKMNSKRRRHERRAAVELKNSAVNGEIAQKLDLNENSI